MKILIPQGFYSIVKDKHLLLDTSIFIDSFINPEQFGLFFNELKNSGCILVTIDAIIVEFIKGVQDSQKFQEKELWVSKIIDSKLSVDAYVWEKVINLLKEYKDDGKSASVADLLLAAILAKYSGSVFLLTKNLSDFPSNIFNLETYLNLSHHKGLHSYGVLSYKKS